jgi:hypothetical protein
MQFDNIGEFTYASTSSHAYGLGAATIALGVSQSSKVCDAL